MSGIYYRNSGAGLTPVNRGPERPDSLSATELAQRVLAVCPDYSELLSKAMIRPGWERASGIQVAANEAAFLQAQFGWDPRDGSVLKVLERGLFGPNEVSYWPVYIGLRDPEGYDQWAIRLLPLEHYRPRSRGHQRPDVPQTHNFARLIGTKDGLDFVNNYLNHLGRRSFLTTGAVAAGAGLLWILGPEVSRYLRGGGDSAEVANTSSGKAPAAPTTPALHKAPDSERLAPEVPTLGDYSLLTDQPLRKFQPGETEFDPEMIHPLDRAFAEYLSTGPFRINAFDIGLRVRGGNENELVKLDPTIVEALLRASGATGVSFHTLWAILLSEGTLINGGLDRINAISSAGARGIFQLTNGWNQTWGWVPWSSFNPADLYYSALVAANGLHYTPPAQFVVDGVTIYCPPIPLNIPHNLSNDPSLSDWIERFTVRGYKWNGHVPQATFVYLSAQFMRSLRLEFFKRNGDMTGVSDAAIYEMMDPLIRPR